MAVEEAFPAYREIAARNRAWERDYRRLCKRRRDERSALPSPARLDDLRHALSDVLALRLRARASDPMPELIQHRPMSHGGDPRGARMLLSRYRIGGAGGDDIDCTLLHGGHDDHAPLLCWLPDAGPHYTGSQSAEDVLRGPGLGLLAAGLRVLVPELPSMRSASVTDSKRRLLAGRCLPGDLVAEAAQAVGAACRLAAVDAVLVAGRGLAGLVAVMLAQLDRRVAGVAAMQLPCIGDARVHEALSVPGFNACTGLEELLHALAPRPLACSLDSAAWSGAAAPPRLARLARAGRCSQLRSEAQALRWLSEHAGARPRRGRRVPDRIVYGLRPCEPARPIRESRARSAWQRRRSPLRRRFAALLGLDRQRAELQLLSRSRLRWAEREQYVLRYGPHRRSALGIYRPPGAKGPLPVVLCLPGSSSDIARVERHYAHEVVARGWMAAVLDARVALYPFHPGIAERTAMIGQSMADICAAMDPLFARADVDADRVACMGVSQGGTHSWMLPALDERIACAVPVCGLTSYRSVCESVRDERIDGSDHSYLDSHGIYYYLPGALGIGEQQDLAALIAPRPLFVITATADNCFPLAGVREAARDLRRIYHLLGAPKNFRYREFVGPHSMPPEERERAYRFIGGVFRS